MNRFHRSALGALTFLLAAAPVTGQRHAESHGSSSSDAVHGAAQEAHPVEHRNEFMLFLGDTRKGGENEVTVGFDYLRALGGHWGVGIFLDYARGEFEREYIAGVGAFWAPFAFAPDLHLFAGAGWERLDEDHGAAHAHGDHDAGDAMEHDWTSEDLVVGRIGGSYLFHLGSEGRFVLSPQAFYDVVQGSGRDATVFGLGFGYLF